ncbi:MAG: hypothetical protein C5B54_01270 [Acidobacteria bacterium]|nr:MAG: hypothetical protein C5B54_01270 [Acidobacteriota bacterium]
MKSDDLSGQTLSHYQIIRQLGSGGMGVVYLAQDTQLDRTVALKILPSEVASDEERMRRFVREAKAASAIDHPNIVHVYEIGQANGVNFIALQYVEGETLHNKIAGQPLPLDELLQIAIQMADAIAEAHTHGIIHRDIKSGNVMVSTKGAVKVLDFGLARIERQNSPAASSEIQTVSQKTKSGEVVGTVAYMSPEQALGRVVDQRSDIFSIGVTFYEMATGKLPFSGATVPETIDQIVHDQPESIARLNYNVPAQLESIIRKCLEKSSGSRYQSASEILIDLKNLKRDLDSTKLVAFRERRSAPGRKFWISIAVVLCAALAALGYYYYGIKSHREIRALAVLPLKNINLDPDDEYLSDGITDSIINNLSLIRQIRVMARGTVFTYKNREVDPRELGKELGVDGIVSGKLVKQGDLLLVTVDFVDTHAGNQIWGQQYERKLADILSLQYEISKDISDELRIRLTGKEQSLVSRQYTQSSDAYQLYLQGQFYLYQRTPDSTQKAMGYFRDAIQSDPSYALAYDGLSSAYLFLGITGALLGGVPPKDVMPQAKQNALKAIALDNTLAQPHATLANIHFNYDLDWEGADKELDKAVELNPNYPISYAFRALMAAGMGQKEKSLTAISKFKELDPGYVAGTQMAIGNSLYWLREYDQAIKQLRTIIELAPNFPNAHLWLGAAYLEKDEGPQAIDELQKAVLLSRQAPVARIVLAIALSRTGKKQDAENILNSLLKESKTRYIPEFYLACLFGALGKNDEAFAWLNKAYEARSNGLGITKSLPWLDPLRSDPRFGEFLKKLNLPE